MTSEKGQNFLPERIEGTKNKALLKKEVRVEDAAADEGGADRSEDWPGRHRRHVHCHSQELEYDLPIGGCW